MTYVITRILNRAQIPNGAGDNPSYSLIADGIQIIRARCTAAARKDLGRHTITVARCQSTAGTFPEKCIAVFVWKDGEQIGGEYLTDDDEAGLTCSLNEYYERLDAWAAGCEPDQQRRRR